MVDKPDKKIRPWRLVVVSHGGTFLLTQIMAIGIGYALYKKTDVEDMLLILDLIAVVGVVLTIKKRAQKSKKKQPEIENTK